MRRETAAYGARPRRRGAAARHAGPNTTYALDFGSAIRDNNEGNPLYSMRYVFSTGGEIDSMICSGYTADAYEADSVPRSFLWFFPADSTAVTPEYDSTLYLHRPSVIARAENNGIFIAQNLEARTLPHLRLRGHERQPALRPLRGPRGLPRRSPQPGRAARLRNLARLRAGLRHGRGRNSLPAHVHRRRGVPPPDALAEYRASEPPPGHALLQCGAPAHRGTALRQHSGRTGDRRAPDPGPRHPRPVWFDLPAEELPDTIRGTVTYLRHDSLNTLQPVTELP